MAKKHRPLSLRPNPAARLSALRPQLDRALQQEHDPASVLGTVELLLEGLKPEAALPILMAAFAAHPEAQTELAPVLPEWLNSHGYATVLAELTTRRKLDDASTALASTLLAPLGINAAPPSITEQNPFYAANFVGDENQSSISLFWYTNPQRQRVFGLSFLIDFQPPWEGAVKESFKAPQATPTQALAVLEDRFRSMGNEPLRLPAAEAKQRLLTAFVANCAAGVRLHRDVVADRELILRHVLALPDAPNTPAFSAADFDFLATNGRRAEDIQRDEQRNGYQTRMPNGKIIRVIKPTDW